MDQLGEASVERAPYNKKQDVEDESTPTPDLKNLSSEEGPPKPTESALTGVEVVKLRAIPSRSLTVSYQPCRAQRRSDLRQRSLLNLKRGHTGETESRKFRAALQRDSVYETHPGWESIKRLKKVIG